MQSRVAVLELTGKLVASVRLERLPCRVGFHGAGKAAQVNWLSVLTIALSDELAFCLVEADSRRMLALLGIAEQEKRVHSHRYEQTGFWAVFLVATNKQVFVQLINQAALVSFRIANLLPAPLNEILKSRETIYTAHVSRLAFLAATARKAALVYCVPSGARKSSSLPAVAAEPGCPMACLVPVVGRAVHTSPPLCLSWAARAISTRA